MRGGKWGIVTRFLVFWLPVLAYMALIFFMSSGPVGSPFFSAIPDYYLHSLGYAVMSVLAFWGVHEGLEVAKGRGGYTVPVLITVLYGISDEYHQKFVLSRQSDIRDVMADGAGALLGVALLMLSTWLIASYRRTQ